MRTAFVNLSAFVLVVAVGGCTAPPAGVLTLAPAGMHTNGTCTPHPDGSLTMSAGATADSVVYTDAGAVSVTVTAKVSAAERPLSVEIWFGGESIGSTQVQDTVAQALRFRTRARKSGPKALRLTVRSANNTAPADAIAVEKIVVTQP